jgi:DNA modification methylase
VELPTAENPAVLIRGDCLEVLRSLPDDCADAFVTDPPYCSGAATEAGRGGATHQGLRSETIRDGRFEWFSADNMTTAGLVWLLRAMAVEADRVLRDNGSLCVFCDWRMAFTLGPAMESAGFRMRNLMFWDKESFGCGSGFRPQHEVILHLTKRAPSFHAADEGNVIRFKSKRVRSGERRHPTEKPVDLFRQILRVVCPVGGLAVDPFAGSFASAEASAMEQMRFVGIEKDPRYVDIGRQRMAGIVGGLFGPAPAAPPAELFA